MANPITIVSDTHKLLEDVIREFPVRPEHVEITMAANRGSGRPVTAPFDPDYVVRQRYDCRENRFVPNCSEDGIEDIWSEDRWPSRIEFTEVVPHSCSEALRIFSEEYLESLLDMNYGLESGMIHVSGFYSPSKNSSVVLGNDGSESRVEVRLSDPYLDDVSREKLYRFGRDLYARYVEGLEQVSLF